MPPTYIRRRFEQNYFFVVNGQFYTNRFGTEEWPYSNTNKSILCSSICLCLKWVIRNTTKWPYSLLRANIVWYDSCRRLFNLYHIKSKLFLRSWELKGKAFIFPWVSVPLVPYEYMMSWYVWHFAALSCFSIKSPKLPVCIINTVD